ncbi:hypothetical protein CEXT_27521 [Caerostris extrusa]|uniref:Uncharacterized protein n=1 Tax=Caerostris extrusa TaxID=172846 RepID=A0AAV4T4Z2_CAEEX|nr:hypothetical protein CEXT_27521 [Caerostris extrusa]
MGFFSDFVRNQILLKCRDNGTEEQGKICQKISDLNFIMVSILIKSHDRPDDISSKYPEYARLKTELMQYQDTQIILCKLSMAILQPHLLRFRPKLTFHLTRKLWTF